MRFGALLQLEHMNLCAPDKSATLMISGSDTCLEFCIHVPHAHFKNESGSALIITVSQCFACPMNQHAGLCRVCVVVC